MSDSILLGSLHNYRLRIAKWEARERGESTTDPNTQSLSLAGHTLAGVLAGWTVSFFISPIEMLKAKLQMQVGRIEVVWRATVATTGLTPLTAARVADDWSETVLRTDRKSRLLSETPFGSDL